MWAAALIPACIVLFMHLDLMWLGITLAVLIAIAAVLTVRGRRLTGWIAAVFSWRRRHRNAADAAVGARRRRDRACRATTSRCAGRATT